MRRIVLVNDEQTAPPGVSGTRTSELLLFEQSRLCDRGLCLLLSAVTRSIVYHRSHFLILNFYLYTESNEYRAPSSKSARPASSTDRANGRKPKNKRPDIGVQCRHVRLIS